MTVGYFRSITVLQPADNRHKMKAMFIINQFSLSAEIEELKAERRRLVADNRLLSVVCQAALVCIAITTCILLARVFGGRI